MPKASTRVSVNNPMKKFTVLVACLSLLKLASCSKQPATDFTTPEGAILMLEDAYRKKDLQAAVDAKDFVAESRVMLSTLETPFDKDEEIVEKSAEVLELAFRTE